MTGETPGLTHGEAIRATGLTKRYGDAPALGPVDLVVCAGERVALVGHNGSGKTTLIRILAGLLDPTAGTSSVFGARAGSIEARRRLSYLSDQPVFYDDLSLAEHLEFVARLHPDSDRDWPFRAVALLDRVGLGARADDLPSTFSRGLRQKAAICLAFVRPFDVLVVDEPFVGLDRGGRIALLDLFDAAHAEGRTLLVATHELATVERSPRVIALRDGAVAYDGGPSTDLAALVES